MIWLGIVLIIGIVAFFIGKYLCTKIRKKRVNELDDNYDYQINEENTYKCYEFPKVPREVITKRNRIEEYK